MTAAVLDVLGAFLVHGTILLLLAFSLSRVLAGREPLVEDAAWKAAVLGALVTASVQVALPVDPWLGRLDLAAVGTEVPAVASVSGASVTPVAPPVPVPDALSLPRRPESGSALWTSPAAGASATWILWALAWAVGAGMSLAALGGSGLRLRRRLLERREIDDPAIVGILRRLELVAGVRRPCRLSSSATLETPVAWGIFRSEICLPDRVLEDMDPAGVEAVLAHELAHVVRRDPVWLLGFLLVESVLFFQPLYRLARRRWVEASEVACDDWAIGRTRRPEVLARRLADVASWIIEEPAAPVPAMARPGSPLGRRIRRLMAESTARPLRPWARAAMIATLALVVLAAPGIGKPPAGKPPVPPVPPTPQAAPNAPPAEPAELPEIPLPPEEPGAPLAPGELADLAELAGELPEMPELPEIPDLPEAELAMALEEAARSQAYAGHDVLTEELAEALERLPTPEQLEQIRAEVARAVEEARRAMREQSEGLRLAKREVERELQRARTDLARAHRDAAREIAAGHRERVQQELDEVRRQLERERAEIARERARLEEERRHLEEARQELLRAQEHAAPPEPPDEVK